MFKPIQRPNIPIKFLLNTIHIYSGITSGRVLSGELLCTKILEVNLFTFAYRLFGRDFSPLDGTHCNKLTSRIFVNFSLCIKNDLIFITHCCFHCDVCMPFVSSYTTSGLLYCG